MGECTQNLQDWGYKMVVRPAQTAFDRLLAKADCQQARLSVVNPPAQFEVTLREQESAEAHSDAGSDTGSNAEREDLSKISLRREPSSTAAVVAFLESGATVTVTETKVVDGVMWLRVPSGTQAQAVDHATSDGATEAKNGSDDEGEHATAEVYTEEDSWLQAQDRTRRYQAHRVVPVVAAGELHVSGKPGMAVAFDGAIRSPGVQTIEFFNHADCQPEQRVGSVLRSDDISADKAIELYGRHIYVKVALDLVVCPEIRVAAVPAEVARDPWHRFMVPGRFALLESTHPYADNLHTFDVVRIPNAVSIAVMFDPRSATEANYDYIQFLQDKSDSTHWYGEAKYTGGRGGSEKNFPGMSGYDPLIIRSEEFTLHFHSDGSNNDWGYRMIAFDAALLNAPQEEVVEEEDATQSEVPRKAADDLFLYFENRTNGPQTVRLNMPVTDGSAFYELHIASHSTAETFLQAGWAALDAEPVAPRSAQLEQPVGVGAVSVPCLGAGSTRRTYAVDGVSGMSASQRWTKGTAQPYAKMVFKAGTVLGCHVSITEGKISVSKLVSSVGAGGTN